MMRDLTTATAQIVAAQAATGMRLTDDLLDMIVQVHATLMAIDASPDRSVEPVQAAAPAVEPEAAPPPAPVVEEPRKPATDIDKSITADRLICLECGDPVILMTRHLKRRHDLTPQQYRLRWELDRDYPMTAPAYAASKRDLAVAKGFGQSVRPPVRGAKVKAEQPATVTRNRLKPAFQRPARKPELTVVEERELRLVD